MEKYFETLILGAGPAGLSAGIFLKEGAILEKKQEIGKPVQCGEGLAEEFLVNMGFQPEKEWVVAEIKECEIFLPEEKKVILPGKLFILDREKFEKWLAKKLKIEIFLEEKAIDVERKSDFWIVKTQRNRVFKCRYLIGADGPASLVRKKVFNKDLIYFPCLQYLVEIENEIETDRIKIFFDREKFPFGYSWIFPKGKNLANVGVGGKGNLKNSFEWFLKNVVEKNYGKTKLILNKSGVVPTGGANLDHFKNNCFLIGDAGGMADPIFGGGIGPAILAGKLAAKSILKGNPKIFKENIKKMPQLKKSLLLASKIFYSFENQTLKEGAEVFEKMKIDLFELKKEGIKKELLKEFLKKKNLRKNWSRFLKLYFIFKEYEKGKSDFSKQIR